MCVGGQCAAVHAVGHHLRHVVLMCALQALPSPAVNRRRILCRASFNRPHAEPQLNLPEDERVTWALVWAPGFTRQMEKTVIGLVMPLFAVAELVGGVAVGRISDRCVRWPPRMR